MYPYKPVYFRNQRQTFPNQIPAFPFHLQNQLPLLNQMNGIGRPGGWSSLVHPGGFWNPGGLGSFGSLGHKNWTAPVNQMGLNVFGQMMGLGGLGGPPGWGSYGNPMSLMGLGNNIGYGQPGMLGGMLNIGKGALGGLGMLSNLISLGKFFI
ncbi:hypothetical protein [Niallia sp. Krafla_26]|uniref:hypothetical protein n=1 Tax=Niallia sp. Krafla_26 TaxID=3064703 RepID=UPI003D16EE09